FQAEDGIRDRNVTGVQTCALPISLIAIDFPTMSLALPNCARQIALPRMTTRGPRKISSSRRNSRPRIGVTPRVAKNPAVMLRVRSEERRVGKEWRWWRWRENEKQR